MIVNGAIALRDGQRGDRQQGGRCAHYREAPSRELPTIHGEVVANSRGNILGNGMGRD